MNQSQIWECDAELFGISFGMILKLCDSPGSLPVDQIGLGWENVLVMESFLLCESLPWAAPPCHCFIPQWSCLKVPDSTVGAGWESSALRFGMKTYQVVYYP